jgi:hypothetical protein
VSTFVHVEIECPHCGAPFEVPILKGMHITRIPEYRTAILDRTFQVFSCPACAGTTRVEASTVYTDFDRYHYVAVEESVAQDLGRAIAREQRRFDESFTLGPPIANELAARMAASCRLVVGIEALREKLVIWDAGLDDRVVEAVKGDRMLALGLEPTDELWRVSTVLDGGHLLFARLDPPLLEGRDPVLAPMPALRGHETVPSAEYDRREAELHQTARVLRFPWLNREWLVDLYFGHPTTVRQVAAAT